MSYGKLSSEYGYFAHTLQVLHSEAGFYIGTFNESGPISRESEYFSTEELATNALVKDKWCQREHP